MNKFNYSTLEEFQALCSKYRAKYDDISEPLKEYDVLSDGSIRESTTSMTLLGVKKMGNYD